MIVVLIVVNALVFVWNMYYVFTEGSWWNLLGAVFGAIGFTVAMNMRKRVASDKREAGRS